jgi:hypothetical protein
LLTAWATAGVLGPVLIGYIREYQIANGVPKAQAYDVTMYILAGLLLLGFICNLLIRPVDKSVFMTEQELAAERQLAHDKVVASAAGGAVSVAPASSLASHPVTVYLAWLAVGIPMLLGIWITLQKAIVLFK